MAILRSWDQETLGEEAPPERDGIRLSTVLPRSAVDEYLETSPDAMIVADHSGSILACNPATEQLFDLDHDALTSLNLSSLFAPELNGHLAIESFERVQGPDASEGSYLPRRLEIEGRVRGGTLLPLCLTVTPLSRSVEPLLLAVVRESAYSPSTAKQVASAAYRAATQEMMALQRELLVEIAQDNGVHGIARVLHHRTGRKVLIIDPAGQMLAGAGYGAHDVPEDRLTAGCSATDRLRSLHGVRERRADSWTAAACPDQTLLGRISIHDPAGDLPEVDLMSLEQAASILTVELLRARTAEGTGTASLTGFAAELLEGRDLDQLRSQAATFGYDLDRPHQTIAMDTPSADTAAIEVAEQVARNLGVMSPLVTARSSRLVLLSTNELDWELLAAALSGAFSMDVRIGIGGPYPITELNRSLTEAVFALELGTTVRSEAPVTAFADLGVWKMLVDSTEPRKLREIVDEWIGPLAEHDSLHGSELVKTLTVYLKASCAAETAAAALHVHRNTLRYRLSKIYQVSGRDLTDPDQRFQLELACRARIVLQALETA
jgi:PAS domain S-box-containing protein